MEINTKNYNKQKNYLLLYLLYLSIYPYLSYTYTILCLSPPQTPLYYEIFIIKILKKKSKMKICNKSDWNITKTMRIRAKNYNKQKITYPYTCYTYLYTPIYPIPILFYAYLPHRDLYTYILYSNFSVLII